MCDHSSTNAVADALKQPTRTTEPSKPICRPYSVLLPVGFALPVLLPEPRCAFTAPFRPYRAEVRRFVFCGTFPQVRNEFLSRPGVTRHRHSVEPGLSSKVSSRGRPTLWQDRPSRRPSVWEAATPAGSHGTPRRSSHRAARAEIAAEKQRRRQVRR